MLLIVIIILQWEPTRAQPGNGVIFYQYKGADCYPTYKHLRKIFYESENIDLGDKFTTFLTSKISPKRYTLDELQFFILLLFDIAR